ncbi:class I SAM-dependent DNA methyltransferase [Winogradskya consettensis]|uniref:class I SAM-dependent DNA methyltransferase n=1 Tax=Winogradskya consettensis TaxID=113560 RepID=UPI001BB3B108|nr:class I SAM-dependent methyltransferase [Actinoplanes consettensis]
MERPFYDLHAEAYDLIINDSVKPWCDAVDAQLAHASSILDAGCGTGRHAAEMIARGHRVELADAAPRLLAQAAARCPSARTQMIDLCMLPASDYDAVMCRGVLNDMISDGERAAAIAALARSLRPGGKLFLDVREAGASRERADGKPRTRAGFTSRTTWDNGLLRVRETYAMGGDVTEYHFTMRPWTVESLTGLLRDNGLRDVAVGGGAGRRTPDRLFVVAS